LEAVSLPVRAIGADETLFELLLIRRIFLAGMAGTALLAATE
jgi:hypothetical protein